MCSGGGSAPSIPPAPAPLKQPEGRERRAGDADERRRAALAATRPSGGLGIQNPANTGQKQLLGQ